MESHSVYALPITDYMSDDIEDRDLLMDRVSSMSDLPTTNFFISYLLFKKSLSNKGGS